VFKTSLKLFFCVYKRVHISTCFKVVYLYVI